MNAQSIISSVEGLFTRVQQGIGSLEKQKQLFTQLGEHIQEIVTEVETIKRDLDAVRAVLQIPAATTPPVPSPSLVTTTALTNNTTPPTAPINPPTITIATPIDTPVPKV